MEKSLRKKIELRLEEKQKTSLARQQIAWLLLVTHAIIMFGIYRIGWPYVAGVSHHHAGYLVIASLVGLMLSLAIVYRQVKADEIELAVTTAWLAVAIALLSTILIVVNIYNTFHQLEEPAVQRPGFALAPQLFFLLTAAILVVYLLVIRQRLKNFFIHSRNRFVVLFTLTFVTYITFVWIMMMIL